MTTTRCSISFIGINVFSMAGALVAAMVAATAPAQDFVVRDVRVFDGREVIDHADVWIEAGKIKATGKQLAVPVGVEVVDGTGCTLLPGLIDAHTHTWSDALQRTIVFGVTTQLDMFSDFNFVRQIKQREAEGKNLDAADIRSAGILATVRGGHGTQFGFAIPTLSTPAEAKVWVDARVEEGSDYIKIVYDDFSQYGYHRPTLSKETMKAIIDAAHAARKLAVVHIGSQQQATDAIEAGADGLVHLFIDTAPTEAFIALAAKHRVFVVPTLAILENLGRSGGASLIDDERLGTYLSRDSRDNLRKSIPLPPLPCRLEYAAEAARKLHKAGVVVLAGTDAPNPGTAHGASLHRELELLEQAGLTPVEALTAATSSPAAAFRLNDRGRIAAGTRADLVLVHGDPTQDILATRSIVAVWKKGHRIDRDAYRAKVERELKSESTPTAAAVPAGPEVLISDFEDAKLSAKFGAGWSLSTDIIMGGKSVGEIKPDAGGANGSKCALRIAGTIGGGTPYAWAGAMFSPGTQIFAPADLSTSKQLKFWTKGDGKTYRVLVFTTSGGTIPASQTFVAESDWKEFMFPFAAFNGTDGHDVSAILFVGGPAAGKFEFWLDDVGLQ